MTFYGTAQPPNNSANPDGHRIASGGADHTVRLWNADTGQQIGQPLTGHTDIVDAVAFSPDGRSDGTVKVWSGPAAWRDDLCATLTQNMSHQQWSAWVSPDIEYIKVCPDAQD